MGKPIFHHNTQGAKVAISRETGQALPSGHILASGFTRWDEKAGLLRDAIRSQCSTCSRHKEKETGNAED